nr:MAG TPA: hypothetical protein [Caudoviricetes sp.]DAQ60194.1 MAG TPA: hypothetical protein [Caudoviricetes sp.]
MGGVVKGFCKRYPRMYLSCPADYLSNRQV